MRFRGEDPRTVESAKFASSAGLRRPTYVRLRARVCTPHRMCGVHIPDAINYTPRIGYMGYTSRTAYDERSEKVDF